MSTASAQRSFHDQKRVALSVRLPRTMHLRMREIALRQEARVNDLYQEVLEEFLEQGLPGQPFLQAPPTSAQPVTLWLEPDFLSRLRRTLVANELAATNVVLTALLNRYGKTELLRAS
jgi:hypothetical protein